MAASLAWGGYSNGYIPEAAMQSIGGGFQLEATVARQFLAAAEELRLGYGINLLAYVAETYRNFAGQVYQKNRWTALGFPNNAADPGGSIHGWAKAIDFNADALQRDGIYDIVMAILAKYGFIRDVSGESWHVSFREAQVASWASGTITPIEEDDMFTEDDRNLAKASNNGIVDTVVRLYRIEQKLDELRVWTGLMKYVLIGNETPEKGLRAIIIKGLEKLGVQLDSIDKTVDEVKATLPSPVGKAVAPDLKSLTSGQ